MVVKPWHCKLHDVLAEVKLIQLQRPQLQIWYEVWEKQRQKKCCTHLNIGCNSSSCAPLFTKPNPKTSVNRKALHSSYLERACRGNNGRSSMAPRTKTWQLKTSATKPHTYTKTSTTARRNIRRKGSTSSTTRKLHKLRTRACQGHALQWRCGTHHCPKPKPPQCYNIRAHWKQNTKQSNSSRIPTKIPALGLQNLKNCLWISVQNIGSLKIVLRWTVGGKEEQRNMGNNGDHSQSEHALSTCAVADLLP